MDNNLPDLSAPNSSKKWIYIGIALVFLAIYTIAALTGYKFFFGNKAELPSITQWKGNSTVSGTLDLNGTPPQGATIAVEAKRNGESSYTIVASGISPIDGATWSWGGAESGVDYSFRAVLQTNGNTVARSDNTNIVAPATEEVLRMNLPSASFAAGTATMPSDTTSAQTQTPSSISGIFNLNGYIPPTSTINILARKQGDSNFIVVAQSIPAIDNGAWSWTNSIQNTTYEVQAVVSTGSTSLSSQVVTMTAPATNEVLTINSNIQPPTPAIVSISGTFNLNGSIPSGSTISVATRVTGTSQFNTVLSGINAINNATWSWNQATSGTSYDIQASLISNGNTVAQSQILTVSAAASGESLTINATNQPPTPPSGTITNNCVGTSNGLWQVSFNYNNNNAVQNAQQFQFQVGTSSGGNQMVSVTNNPSNPNQSQNYTSGFVFTQGQTYYAQYSYATCQNCSTWSTWSAPLQFYCNPQAPTNTPTQIPTPSVSPTSGPTNTPIPTPTNTPSPTVAPTAVLTPTHAPTATPIITP